MSPSRGRRPKPDPEGRRRASVEHGRGKPRNQTQGGKPPKRPSTSMPRREGRGATLKRRLGAVGRFGVKHRGSLTCVFGSLLVAVSLVALEGTVQLLTVLFSLGVVTAGAAVHHHQRTKLMNRNPNVSTPSWSERRNMAQSRRANPGGYPTMPQPADGRVTVTSHDRETGSVRQHTRARPGQGAA